MGKESGYAKTIKKGLIDWISANQASLRFSIRTLQRHITVTEVQGKCSIVIEDLNIYSMPETFHFDELSNQGEINLNNTIVDLRLIGLNLVEFPQVICRLKNLKTLHIVGVNMEAIPDGGLPDSIEELKISLCPLRTLDSLGHLKQLQTLDLSRTKLERFPELSDGARVRTLNISTTNIRWLNNLDMLELEELDVSFTPISRLPSKWLHGSLKHLNLQNSGIVFAETRNNTLLANCSNLEALNLSSLKIAVVPVITSKKLKRLELSFTDFKEFPELCFDSLEYLGVCMCEFNRLPIDLILHLLNRVGPDAIQDQFGAWHTQADSAQDRGIFISGLLLKEMDVRYLKMGSSTEAFLYQYKAQDKKVRNRTRLFVLGDNSANKHQLLEELFRVDFERQENHCINIYKDSRVSLPDLPLKAKMSIWEIEDSDIQDLVNPLLFTESNIYMVVLDGRNQRDLYGRAVHWLKTIECYAPYESVLFVIARQEQKLYFDPSLILPAGSLIKLKQPAELCMDNGEWRDEELEVLRQELSACIKASVGYHFEIPITWDSLEAHLTALLKVRSLISYKQFEELCEYYSVVTDKEIKSTILQQLLLYLRETGVIVYSDLQRQPDTSADLSSPEWLGESARTALLCAQRHKGAIEYKTLAGEQEDINADHFIDQAQFGYVMSILAQEGLFVQAERPDHYYSAISRSMYSHLDDDSNLLFARQRWVKEICSSAGTLIFKINCPILTQSTAAKILKNLSERVPICFSGQEGACIGTIEHKELFIRFQYGTPGKILLHRDQGKSSDKSPTVHRQGNPDFLNETMAVCQKQLKRFRNMEFPASVLLRLGDKSCFVPLSEIEGCVNRKQPTYFCGTLEYTYQVEDLVQYISYQNINP